MQLAVRVGQWFSLLPANLSPGAEPSFRWKSLRVAYCLLIAVCLVVRTVAGLVQDVDSEDTVSVIGGVAANLFALSIALLFLRLARCWHAFSLVFLQVPHTRGLGHRLRLITVTMLCLALTEHSFDRLSLVLSTMEVNKYDSLAALFRDALANKNFFEASITILLRVVETVMAFFYIFNDMFLILVSVSVTHRLRLFNERMRDSLFKGRDQMSWEHARCSFNVLYKLTKEVDCYLNANVLVTFTQNLFFICFQLLYFLRNAEEGTIRQVFRICSFAYVLARTFTVSFVIASINDQSKVARTLLFSVPSRSYCREVSRFLHQATSEEMALTGLNLFRVTRSFMLTVAGTITTYEVILLQIHRD